MTLHSASESNAASRKTHNINSTAQLLHMHFMMVHMYSRGPFLSVGAALCDSNILRSSNLRIVRLDSSGILVYFLL